ncbi:hypothetical protein B0J13DRAFT_221504 [Dactylonectria estremocensis]|uniref:Uncharacterized protein n=1 Tax=Dactylonectria estremocensis TaxID=1079267 RepID=A0A9P9F891_9HYPO|nr:hypothetical protein B0J13DRAFT_221504 [Dactylonectria estremocensis]
MAPTPSTMLSYLASRGAKDGVPVPIAGDVMGLLVALASISVLSICLFQRITAIKVWTNLPAVVWLVFAIYVDSFLFVIVTTILQQVWGVNSSYSMCHGAILLCLVCYVTTKIFIYVFLVEKAHIIRGTPKTRLQSKLYCFNSFGMLGLYGVVVILNFIFRIAKFENGVCIIGMRSISMIPLISFDAVVNIYLTILFLIPLKNLYSFKNMPKTPANERLKNVAFRTFVGSCCTLVSSIVNLSVLMALNGEPGWVCLMCCNSDVLFSALVIQWVTSKDNAGSGSPNNTNNYNDGLNSHGPRDPHSSTHQMNTVPPAPPSPQGTDAEISLVATATARSSDDGRDMDMTKVSSSNGGVIVTTTIHRQSRPTSGFGLDLEGSKPDDDDDDVTYGYPPRPPSYGVNSHHEIPEPPQTHITGGKPDARY